MSAALTAVRGAVARWAQMHLTPTRAGGRVSAILQGIGPTDARRQPQAVAGQQRPLGEEAPLPKRDALGGDAFASVFASVGEGQRAGRGWVGEGGGGGLARRRRTHMCVYTQPPTRTHIHTPTPMHLHQHTADVGASSPPPPPINHAFPPPLPSLCPRQLMFQLPHPALQALKVHGHAWVNGGNVMQLAGAQCGAGAGCARGVRLGGT